MVRLGLLFRWREADAYRYRSRLAESVRLVVRLRQLFPYHLKQPNGWLTGPTLVSDFRLLMRPREYPRRDRDSRDAIAAWADDPQAALTPLQVNVLRALLGTVDGPGFPLAGFQCEATSRILCSATATVAAGTVICAGTGTGKTLAFYLPTLTRLAGMIEQDNAAWTRALAIYPRNELLKDQFTETCRQARRIRSALGAANLRPVSIGAFFGSTPFDASTPEGTQWDDSWAARAGGRVCPFIVCPGNDCTGAMIWKDEDRRRGAERLVCERCRTTVESDEIVLTRRRMTQHPPDILFTTTDMMNQRLTDDWSCRLFGVNQPPARRPVLLLLDEAHTYDGTAGAQVAYLLRRWKHRTEAVPHFVGLSATLMDAAGFFAQLTGLSPGMVREIHPAESETIKEGTEYMLALRGDPVSGANLLSATIQTAMLLRRVLDRTPGIPSEGTFGSKVFVFTDDLDVTNRMYFNLLDAEGQNAYGRLDPGRHPGGSLANLRAGKLPDEERRFAHGQSWRLCERLGHDLEASVRIPIDRVSSQDSGLDTNAEIIVATSSLEVGFNDPEVGAVLQHKAPRNAASFLQRKGRAGRDRRMRPLTVVTLSDFGRDQLAFQGYDLLFNPELYPRELPLGNRHILKMQAVYACLDCLAAHLSGPSYGHVWANASRPASCEKESSRPAFRERQKAAARWLEGVLDGGPEFGQLTHWLRRALHLPEEEITSLLWEPPRALMTAVLPTLHRRLHTQWLFGDNGQEAYERYHPLPEFIPGLLNNELNLPEVAIHASQTRRGEETLDDVFSLPAARAILEFAPGRISRRFGISHGLSRHWLPVDPAGPAEQSVDVDSFCGSTEREELGRFFFRGDDEVRQVRVVRPRTMRVRSDAPRNVKDSSKASSHWHSQLLPPRSSQAGVAVDLPVVSPWTSVLEEIRFFTHRQRQPARVRRFSLGSQAVLNLPRGETCEVATRFVLRAGDGEPVEPVALGFAFEADAIRIRLRLPSDWRLGEGSAFAEKMPALRSAWFRRCVLVEPRFDGLYNFFERGWLAEICLAAVTATAVARRVTLPDAWATVRAETGELALTEVLRVIFQASPVEGEDDAAQVEQRRLTDLHAALTDAETLAVLDELVATLWESVGPHWEPWLRERFLATAGAATREAIQQMCPEVDVQGLVVDIDPGLGENGQESSDEHTGLIWMSEDMPGGGGIIERLLSRLTESPRRLLDLMLGALGESDFELADRELRRFLGAVTGGHPTLAVRVQEFRQAGALAETTAAFRQLQAELRQEGIQTTHAMLTALSARLLKSGSSAQTDALMAGIMDRWQNEETRLGVEIEARSLAYALSTSDALDQALSANRLLPIEVGQNRRAWRFNAISALLWPRGTRARNHTLELRNLYAAVPSTERFLVLDALNPVETRVEFGVPDWRSVCETALIVEGSVALVAAPGVFTAFRAALIALLANALDTGALLLYPRLRGIAREHGQVIVRLELVAPGQVAPSGETEPAAASTVRLIVKTADVGRDEVRDLLESLLGVELLAPGAELWLVSPWISDLPVLDNRAGRYAGLEPTWPKRHLTLSELLAFALRASAQTRLWVVTRPDPRNNHFCERLGNLAAFDGTADRVTIDRGHDELHTKGLVATTFLLNGSMNFTKNGIQVFDEAVQLETDAARIAHFRLSLHGPYP